MTKLFVTVVNVVNNVINVVNNIINNDDNVNNNVTYRKKHLILFVMSYQEF